MKEVVSVGWQGTREASSEVVRRKGGKGGVGSSVTTGRPCARLPSCQVLTSDHGTYTKFLPHRPRTSLCLPARRDARHRRCPSLRCVRPL